MLFNIDFEYNPHKVPEDFDKDMFYKRKAAAALADEIVRYIEFKEKPQEDSPKIDVRARLCFLPDSHLEHIIGMLNTIRGISPVVDSILAEIKNEFVK